MRIILVCVFLAVSVAAFASDYNYPDGVDVKYFDLDGNHDDEAKRVAKATWSSGLVRLSVTSGNSTVSGSAVCIGYDRIKNRSYVVTASHLLEMKGKARVALASKRLDVIGYRVDKLMDFALMTVKGKLPVVKIIKKRPKSYKYDTVIGFVGNKLKFTEGRAVVGQSGGVVAAPHGVYAIVSTNNYGVHIWNTLRHMKLTHLVGSE